MMCVYWDRRAPLGLQLGGMLTEPVSWDVPCLFLCHVSLPHPPLFNAQLVGKSHQRGDGTDGGREQEDGEVKFFGVIVL